MTRAASLRFDWGGNTASLATEDQRIWRALELVFGAFRSDSAASPGVHRPTLTATIGEREFTYDSVQRAVLGLEDLVAEQLFDGCEHLLLHAGAAVSENLLLLVLGPSGAGKTTMTLELVRRGFRFLGDEYTALDAGGGELHPFPRCTVVKERIAELPTGELLTLEAESGTLSFLLPEHSVPLEPLPLTAPGRNLGLLFPCFTPGATTTVRPLGVAEACAQILPSTFNFEDNEGAFWPALSELATRAKACEVEYSDVESGITAALEFFAPR